MSDTTTHSAKKVTVIGLGLMGTAITRAFLSKGFQVTAWNRDKSKATSVVAKGAIEAADSASAITASSLVVICVSDYKATRSILQNHATLLNGRTIVQLSTGTPKEAREFDVWVQEHGGVSLNGDILAWPRHIGTSEATISIAGNNAVFQQHLYALQALAGNIEHAGEEPGASAVLFSAVLAYLAGNWIGFCHGALIYEKEGLPVDRFGELIAAMAPMLATESKHMGEVIQHERFAGPESTVVTTSIDLHLLAQHAADANINNEFPKFAAGIFQRAVDAGFGGEEHAAIIKVLRSAG